MPNKDIQQEQKEREAEQAALLANEPDILEGLLSAASFGQDTDSMPVQIVRKGNPAFTFHIRPLAQEEYDKCRKANLTYKRVKGGVRQPEELNVVRYHSMLIHTATTEEDREKVWGNKTAWNRLNVLNGVDLVDKVLMAGEKDRVIGLIDRISGFSDEEETVSQEDLAKN